MNDKLRSRKWLLTINNPDEHDLSHDRLVVILDSFKAVKYWCMCDEIGVNGTYHIHLFIMGDNAIKFTTVKQKFSSAHIDFCRGTAQENRDYVLKEGKYKGSVKEETNIRDTFLESGEIPVERQGQRNDLIDLYDMIKQGLDNYEILEENPEYMLSIDKVERCRQIVKEKEFRNTFRILEVQYISGLTGKGKTRSVLEKYGYENVYRITDYQHPFDSYKGQDVVVFEEFRSSLKINDMLNYLDGYPLDLPCRYNNKIACYTKVFILSNITLEQQYLEVQRNFSYTWFAFLRRISNVKIYDDFGVKYYDCVDDYINRGDGFSRLSESCPFEQV